MAPRANWKGFLRLSLVTCPVALFPATSDSEKDQLQPDQQRTGHPSAICASTPKAEKKCHLRK